MTGSAGHACPRHSTTGAGSHASGPFFSKNSYQVITWCFADPPRSRYHQESLDRPPLSPDQTPVRLIIVTSETSDAGKRKNTPRSVSLRPSLIGSASTAAPVPRIKRRASIPGDFCPAPRAPLMTSPANRKRGRPGICCQFRSCIAGADPAEFQNSSHKTEQWLGTTKTNVGDQLAQAGRSSFLLPTQPKGGRLGGQ